VAMKSLSLIILKDYPIFQQLQLEEALLRADHRNWCLINEGSPDAIVMGISGKTEQMIDPECLRRKPVPVIRRFSGGGTVFVDKNTHFITLIGNHIDTKVSCCPQKILHWTREFYEPLFGAFDFRIQENDYALGDRKFGGNAQYFRKDRWLHHSSLLWDYDSEKMKYLQMPPKMPLYRSKRKHEDFLCRLRDYFSERSNVTTLFLQELSKQFVIKEACLQEIEEVFHSQHRRSTEMVI
jgi:lipoate---protein ligase